VIHEFLVAAKQKAERGAQAEVVRNRAYPREKRPTLLS